jgi:hypothetical protein
MLPHLRQTLAGLVFSHNNLVLGDQGAGDPFHVEMLCVDVKYCGLVSRVLAFTGLRTGL